MPNLELSRVLVPLDGSSADRIAMSVACQVAKPAKAKLFAIHVIQVKRMLPLDAELSAEAEQGEGILESAERIASEFGIRVQTELLQARDIGTAIVDEAAERGRT